MNASHELPHSTALPEFASRLPNVGTTIFTVMSALATQTGAVNLGQGFPDFPCDPRIVDAVSNAMRDGHNQYPPMSGVAPLRHAIADKIERLYGRKYDADREITVTAGATQALLTAILCCVHPGDEVVVIEPMYDSYVPAIELAGGKPVFVSLDAPDYALPFDKIAAAITPKTRLLMINSPHNPTGRVWRAGDMQKLQEIVRGTDLLILSDEVYEHMVFDGQSHHSVLAEPELRERSVAVFSFGKTLQATGLRVGYAVAPRALTAELRKVHQFNTFTIATPLQVAIARYLEERPDCGDGLLAFLGAKRDRLVDALADSDLSLPRAEGSFFQLIDYGALSDAPDTQFAEELLTRARVATIPLSVFYQHPPPMTLLRLCFAKRDETLDEGAARLRAYLRRRRDVAPTAVAAVAPPGTGS